MATVIDELVTVISNRYEGNKDIQSALDGYKRLNRGFQDTVRNMAKGAAILGAALTGVGAVVIKATVPYEQALNDLRAFAEVTQDELDQLDTVARKIGSSGRFGATDVLEGQREFLRNQFSVNETLAATPHLEHLAAAGMMDMDKAANLVAHTLRRFDLGADQVQHVTDVLASMTRETGLNLADLEATFRRAALVADRLNMSFEETAAGVSLLAREGLRPREAGSLLEAMLEDLTDLSEESKEAAQELSRVGLDVDLVKGLASTGQVTKLFDELRKAGADINQIFSTEGIDAAQILFDAGDEFAQLADQFLTAVEGTAQDMKETRDLGLPGAIEDFKSAINALQLSVGSSGLTGMLEWVLDKLAAFVRWLSEASGWLKGFAVAAIAAGPGLLALSVGLKALAIGFRPLTTAIRTSVRLVTHWRASLRLLRMRVSRVTRGLRRFATAIWSRVSPALTALGKGVKAAGLAVRNFAVRLWTRGTAALGRFATSVRTNAIPALSRFAATIWTSSVGALKGLVTNLARASLGMLRFALKAIVAGISGVIAFGVAIWASLIPPLIAATAAVTAFTIALLANPVVLIVAAIIGAFVALGYVIYRFRRQILGALKTALAWVKGNWPLLVGILFGPFGIAAGLIFKFRDDVVGAIMWIKDKIMAIFTSLRDFVIGIWQGLGAAIGGAFRGVINAVISGLNKALDAAASFVEAIKGALDKVPFGNPLGDFLLGVASKLRAGIPNFAIGGIVPGPLGRPLLATVHGGEMVLPVGASRVIAQMLEGFRLGPAALPQAPYHYGQMYRSSVINKSVTVHIHEPIVIQTQATDAQGIAEDLHEAIEDKIRNVAYDHDGPVER